MAGEVATGRLFASVMVKAVVDTPATLAVYGTVINGGCQLVLAVVVPSACGVPLVCVQVAPPVGAGVPVPPAVVAAGFPHSQPHIGTLAPLGSTVVCRAAVRFTTDWAEAMPAVRSRADPARIAVAKVLLLIRMF